MLYSAGVTAFIKCSKLPTLAEDDFTCKSQLHANVGCNTQTNLPQMLFPN